MREFIPKKKIREKQLNLSEGSRETIDSFLERALSIDAKELKDLRARIESNEGLVRMFVHPYFRSGMTVRPEETSIPPLDYVSEGFDRHVVSATREDSAPLFLFEDERRIDDTPVRLKMLEDGKSSGTYILPTAQASGHIVKSFAERVLPDGEWRRTPRRRTIAQAKKQLRSEERFAESLRGVSGTSSFLNLTRRAIDERKKHIANPNYFDESLLSEQFMRMLLKGLGVKKIVVGGMYLGDTEKAPHGCVGTLIFAARELRIPVTLSRYHRDWDGYDVHGKQQEKK